MTDFGIDKEGNEKALHWSIGRKQEYWVLVVLSDIGEQIYWAKWKGRAGVLGLWWEILKHNFLDAETVPDDAKFGDVVYKRQRLRIKSWDENTKAELL